MSDAKKDGVPAFPVMVNHIDQAGGSEVMLEHEGMFLRDYYAAKAMVGFLSGPRQLVHAGKAIEWSEANLAMASYAVADAFIAERNKP